jgi:predicted HTH domain antitoxin
MVQTEALKRLTATFYADGTLSLGKAAELANTSKQDFLDFLVEHNIPPNYDVDDMEEDLEEVKEFLQNEGCI